MQTSTCKNHLIVNILLAVILPLQLINCSDNTNVTSIGNVTSNHLNISFPMEATKAPGAPAITSQTQHQKDLIVGGAERNKTMMEQGVTVHGTPALANKSRRRPPTELDNFQASNRTNQLNQTEKKESTNATTTTNTTTSDTKSLQDQQKDVLVAQNVAINQSDISGILKNSKTAANNTQMPTKVVVNKSNAQLLSTTPSSAEPSTPLNHSNATINTILSPQESDDNRKVNTTNNITDADPKNKTTPAQHSSTTTLPRISTTSTTTTTKGTTVATTTTTTTTAKPKKPLITYGVQDFPDLDANILKRASASANATSKLSLSSVDNLREGPHAQPSQENDVSLSYHHSRDYILPIVAIMFVAPLVIGILITAYRRFRDFWSTRHYRRMDFLVDGMYND